MMNDFYQRFSLVQSKLKAPKGQTNSFGNYRYRSCEDILEAVKPLLQEQHMVLTLSDEIVQLGDRYYIVASATVRDVDSEAVVTNSAMAREASTKKGMDDSQVTGTASSYARKYALNGLFCIDDTKDADTNEYHNTTARDTEKSSEVPPVCDECGKTVTDIGKCSDMSDYIAKCKKGPHRVLCMDCFKKWNDAVTLAKAQLHEIQG